MVYLLLSLLLPLCMRLLLNRASPTVHVILILNRHALGHVVDLVHSHQSGSELKHVISEGNDDELGVLCSLFDVVCYDGDL